MSYSVDLEHARLLCRSQAQAVAAAKRFASHAWVRSHVKVSVLPSLTAAARVCQNAAQFFIGHDEA